MVATRQSPEWATTQAIIRHKRHEVRAGRHTMVCFLSRLIWPCLGATRQAPEWATAQAIIRHKRHEVRTTFATR